MSGAETCPDCGGPPAGELAGGALPPVPAPPRGRPLGRSGRVSRPRGRDRSDDRPDDGTGPRPPPSASRPGRCDRGGPRVHLRETVRGRAADPARSARDARRLGPAVALPARRRARPGRHGRDLPGPRPRPRPRPRRQGDPGGAPRPPRDGPPVRRGGADRRPAPAPGDRPGLRAGPAPRRPAVHRHEAGPGPHPGGAAGGARGARTRTGRGSSRSSSRSARRWPTPTRGA